MRAIDELMLDALVQQAEQSPRRRMNLNFHPVPDDPVQRLFNAIEPDSYVRPHQHVQPARWELMLAVRGACALLAFDANGTVSERLELKAGGSCLGAELPAGAWHTIVALQPGTVFFEVKQGPYLKPSPGAFAHWAPREGDERCAAFVEWYRHARPGDRPPSLG